MPDTEFATHNAEVNVQFGIYNFNDEIAVGLTKRWKHDQIVLSVADLMKLMIDVDKKILEAGSSTNLGIPKIEKIG